MNARCCRKHGAPLVYGTRIYYYFECGCRRKVKP